MQNRIFSTDSAKAIKADAYGYLNAIHYMSPANVAGVGDLCSHRSAGCTALCLGITSGQAGIVSNVTSNDDQGNACRKSRRDKAVRFMRERVAYMRDVVTAIEAEQRKASRLGKKLCVRMNGSTDIAWEGVKCVRNGVEFRSVYHAFPDVQFVDYTKNWTRFYRDLPSNLHLTFSRSETNEAKAIELLSRGVNVAIVFSEPLHALVLSTLDKYLGAQIIDGDQHDLRHLDPRGPHGYIVALKPKGRVAKKDQSGFVVR